MTATRKLPSDRKHPARALRWTLSFGLVIAFVSGCVTTPAPLHAPIPVAAVDQHKLSALLDHADRALESGHLTFPQAGSAESGYRAAEVAEPGNERARRGLETIVEQYLSRASSDIERRQFPAARAMFAQARQVKPDHPGIATTERQLSWLSQASRELINLPASGIASRSQSLATQLAQIGARAKAADDARLIIHSTSDAAGRWIYQQLRKAPGPRRLRAQMVISSPARIELLVAP